jgi:uncharacterized protein YegP (UPF0339 family)
MDQVASRDTVPTIPDYPIWRTLMAGKFEVYEDKSGKFRFRLKAGNGEVVAQGEAYETKDGARNGCEAVQRAAAGASIVDADD